ncbi:hypothetical protein QR680_013760 [Steinernema hermaphroditum]|uniref:Uncharacterized protein n=1 Tax=Steinernema hermaphroditum TaxID=289476 RepID=A0AA39M2T0_9BILA|nr:hypothetical protein QR680_013760 [Steinernema hermaphroditum]
MNVWVLLLCCLPSAVFASQEAKKPAESYKKNLAKGFYDPSYKFDPYKFAGIYRGPGFYDPLYNNFYYTRGYNRYPYYGYSYPMNGFYYPYYYAHPYSY